MVIDNAKSTKTTPDWHAAPELLAGGQDWHISLDPWPFWGQLVDWTVDKQGDINKTDNCLPESMAMSLKYLTGVELPASFIKDVEYGVDYTGYTYFDKAQWFMQKYCDIKTKVEMASTIEEWTWLQWFYLHQGKPIIGLYSFTAPGSEDGHCRPSCRMKPDLITTADPWTGTPRNENYATNYLWSKGVLLGIDRVRYR